MARRGPKHFAKLAFVLAEADEPADTALSHFHERLLAASPGDDLIALWGRKLSSWDFEPQPSWSDSPPRSDERRADVYTRLGFSAELRKALDTVVPVFKEPGPVTISREHECWYTRENAANRSFYWDAYENLLRSKGWSAAAISGLDEAAHSVVERLSDPTRVDAYGARGLVLGYVQSGKTANFTGVTAKAIDAGYRLVIVLGGTLNLLRSQTQRRLDMELIGQENILGSADPSDPDALVGIDYQHDDDWPTKFVSHGARPSALHAFDIERLTSRDEDYKSLARGISALEFEKRDRTLPLYDPQNLHHAAARVMVVKKNKSVLTKLVKDLKKIGPLLSEIPTLIIDDESDQASVNTTDPKKWEAGKVTRTSINGLITDLLRLLPRAQYVGYTATPFANVFIDPGDDEDIFPRDFLISLPRPIGYMGVQDFHDLDSSIPLEERTAERSYANSQEMAHVRGIYEATGDRMQEAMDAFVLSGALKLYRTDHGVPDGPFRHHTMLVHESVKVDDHSEIALRLNSMWHQAGYTGSTGHARLSDLFDSDFSQVSAARSSGLPRPASYAELRPYVSRARQLINSGGSPVVVVNGDTDRYFDQLNLDFDGTPHVWKILVGGTKLSRGFTVEGLTVTYYRRTTRQADTLMQMGRWFGFRPGYQDLVRLYVGREEPLTKTKTVDLYEAFEAICRDEEAFREQLARYAVMVDGKPQVKPEQIPPLVAQHLHWIKPSARNKMFNAELVEEMLTPGQPIEPASYPRDSTAIGRNTERWRPLLEYFRTAPVTFTNPPDSTSSLTRSFTALTGTVPHAELVSVLGNLEWERSGHFAPHLAYLNQLDGSLAKVDDWLLICPQLAKNNRVEATILGSTPLSLARRSRQEDKNSFGRIASYEHRMAAQRLIDAASAPTSRGDADIHLSRTTGVALLYPVIEGAKASIVRAAVRNGTVDPSSVVMAFTLIPPTSAIVAGHPLVRFRAKDSRLSTKTSGN
ncbi:Z1 domain-containing protein [Streptomyces sp. AN091965]|nr:Z1 domain-containing protein [Streptomyces sp. AN091965]MCI3930922.1 Z1 domain-containing protein [Streptomyces sp. AN091965]